ncbi:Solute carrier family 15 member 4 [Blattella germanica]|nr:Solute carrier family 15 member 4 [Blattella germanica]
METETTPLLLRPAPWDPRRSTIAGALVLVTLTLERLAFYALVANLFLFLNLGGWSPRGNMTAVLILVGVAHFSALGGGWLADGLVGRFWALVIGLSLYVVGFTMLTLMASGVLCPRSPLTPSCVPQTYAILICIGIAAGTVRANIPSFGAEQVKYGGADSLRKFFNWYYWCVNTGSLLGVGALSYVAQDMPEGFLRAFADPFVFGSSPVLERRSRSQSQNSVERQSPAPSAQSPSWLDYAKIRYGGSHHDAAVEDVKRLGIILILFTCLLPYWLVFFQIETGFQEQGLHLKIGFPQPGKSSNFNVTIGMGFSLLAALSAAVLEFFSVQRWREGHGIAQVIHNWTYNASDISLLWQIPQYCLVGSAEVFAGVAGLEFAYSAAPRPLQGVAMGMFSAMEGVGSLLGTTLISALSPVWIRHDSQHFQGHLDYYFFLLAGIQGVAFILFTNWLLVRRYRAMRQEIPVGIAT